MACKALLLLCATLLIKRNAAVEVTGTAIIIETRHDPGLISIVQQANDILPADWHVIVFHSATNEVALRLGLMGANLRRLSLVRMEHDMANGNEPASSYTLWYFTANRMMTFQTDGAFCTGADVQRSIDTASQFDFVGPQWKDPDSLTRHGQGANGGFSIRSKSASLDLLRSYPFQDYVQWALSYSTMTAVERLAEQAKESVHSGVFSLNEDAYFSNLLYLVNATIGPPAVADAFAVEAVWNGITAPLAVHAPWFHMALGKLGSLLRLCPAAAPAYFAEMAKYTMRQKDLDVAKEEAARGEETAASASTPRPNSDDFLECTFDAIARRNHGAGSGIIIDSRLGWDVEPGHIILRS